MASPPLPGDLQIGSCIEVSRFRPVPADRLLVASGLLDGSVVTRRLCWLGGAGRRRLRRLRAELAEWWPDYHRGAALQVWHLTGDGVEGRLELLSRSGNPPGIADGRLGPGLSPRLEMGASAERDVPVDETNSTDHLGGRRQLLATPDMIEQMERTGADLLEPYLLEGFGALGAHNDIAHSRPAYLGETVHYRAVLVGASGPRLVYAVSATVGDRVVGHGRHESHVVRSTFGGSRS